MRDPINRVLSVVAFICSVIALMACAYLLATRDNNPIMRPDAPKLVTIPTTTRRG